MTEDQWAAIKAGTFDDMYIGDYWTIDDKIYRIAAFDYYRLCYTDSIITQHHVTLVPDNNMYTGMMESSATTSNGYAKSAMFTSGLNTAKTTINNAFGSNHILTIKRYLVSAVTSGAPSATAGYNVTVDLMSELNVFGCYVMGVRGTAAASKQALDTTQFPLFALNREFIIEQSNVSYWLKEVASSTNFAYVGNYGYILSSSSNTARGVRPSFSIYQPD